MSTTRTRERVLDETWREGDLPPLSSADRLALRVGLALILWGQRHADTDGRAEHTRRVRAAEDVAQARDAALTRRLHAGPTTW
jgi:hypothetical protein